MALQDGKGKIKEGELSKKITDEINGKASQTDLDSLSNDYVEHKAEIATGEDYGHIRLSDIPQQGWEKIADITLSSNATQVNITNIPEKFNLIKVIFLTRNDHATNSHLLLRFNDISSQSYTWFNNKSGSGVTSQTSINFPNALRSSTDDLTLGDILINNFLGNKTLYSSYVEGQTSANMSQISGRALIIPKINKISFIAASGNIQLNSSFIVLGVK